MADFNTSPPSCSGDPDLCSRFTFDNSGPTPDTWFAIFDIGARPLTVASGATIATAPVGLGNNRYAPGLRILTTCSVTVEAGGAILIESVNRDAGDILIRSNGPIAIDGSVSNIVGGSNGLPGDVTIATCCGDITAGPGSLIQSIGTGGGGSHIALLACCAQGNIDLSGLVMARANGTGDGPRPAVQIAAFNGALTIHGDSVEPRLDEYSVAGANYDLFPGVLSWVTQNNSPGSVFLQAAGDIRVFGHGDDPTAPARQSFAAVAAGTSTADSIGGFVDVRAIHGAVSGTNRAFQSFGRYHPAASSRIRLHAGTNIELSRPGGSAAFNPVVDSAASPTAGGGGSNELRAFGGNVFVDANALVSAAGATAGSNALTSCLGVNKLGTIDPPDADAADDSGVCAPAEPTPVFPDCSAFEAAVGGLPSAVGQPSRVLGVSAFSPGELFLAGFQQRGEFLEIVFKVSGKLARLLERREDRVPPSEGFAGLFEKRQPVGASRGRRRFLERRAELVKGTGHTRSEVDVLRIGRGEAFGEDHRLAPVIHGFGVRPDLRQRVAEIRVGRCEQPADHDVVRIGRRQSLANPKAVALALHALFLPARPAQRIAELDVGG